MSLRDLEVLDYWTEFSIETHFRQLVVECQMANATGITETEKTCETYETEETEETEEYTPLN
jgi:hypothetical protein